MKRRAQEKKGLLGLAVRPGPVSELLVLLACLGVWAFLSLAFLVEVTAPLSTFVGASRDAVAAQNGVQEIRSNRGQVGVPRGETAETASGAQSPEPASTLWTGLRSQGVARGEDALSAVLEIAPLVGPWSCVPCEPCATAAPLSR
jgi:hypothetical protein